MVEHWLPHLSAEFFKWNLPVDDLIWTNPIRIHQECEGRIKKFPSRGSPFGSTRLAKTIRIYHECEGRIEKSVPRITVWHHEACQDYKNLS